MATNDPNLVQTIDQATPGFVEIPGTARESPITIWYRTWGNRSGVPVLFVHGGPGQCIADYDNINAKFFDSDKFFVVEVDQRGTGNSCPSVRDDYRHMEYYRDISAAQMSLDFEYVREALGLDHWLVFGGSWGSTLGLDYGERYPNCCLGLILRGVYLNTVPEFDAVYAREAFLNNKRRLGEFDQFFAVAQREVARRGEALLDPNDSQRFFNIYESLILAGDRHAIWAFYAFENNLVAEDPSDVMDPLVIDEAVYPEAQSVAFFECRLFLHGTYERPLELLQRVPQLLRREAARGPVPTWVVQGTGDEVCPEQFARVLVDRLVECSVPCVSYFVDAGHKASSQNISNKLRVCVDQFYEAHTRKSEQDSGQTPLMDPPHTDGDPLKDLSHTDGHGEVPTGASALHVASRGWGRLVVFGALCAVTALTITRLQVGRA